jgi:hypothetical protein
MLGPCPMRRHPLLRLVTASMAIFATSSCLSPTIPMPPPDINSIAPSAGGLWVVTGTCDPGAFVTVYNTTQAQGVVIQDVSGAGTFLVKLPAERCDLGRIWQTQLEDTSSAQDFTFKEHLPTDTGIGGTCTKTP